MKDFENIGKGMPYAEDKDYVSALVESATEKALHQEPKTKTIRLKAKWMAAAAASAVLIAGAGITYHYSLAETQPQVAEETMGPIDIFLNNLSDEDAQLLTSYEIEGISEFEEYL
ncbi:MAG: hypothetical protein K5764_02380 [Prevotella sp.]|nr:hypothetical protein [Prevotella sp.]